MPKEKQSYRDNLERIIAFYPGKEMLNISEVSRFLGLSRYAVKRRFKFNQNYISIAALASQMS